MQKMMTYGEANQILESSLTPSNRCLTKSVAIANNAKEDPLSSYSSNRLVPASAVEINVVKYTITFLDYDGSTIAQRQYEENTTITDAPFPRRTGYTFIGWDPQLAVVTQDASYTAQYGQIEHCFVLPDGTYSTSLNVNVPLNNKYQSFDTIILINGSPYKTHLQDEYYWSWKDSWGGMVFDLRQGQSYDSNTGIFTQEANMKNASIGVVGETGYVDMALYERTPGMDDYEPMSGKTIRVNFTRTEDVGPTQWTVTYLGHDGDTFATRTVNDGEAAPNIDIGYTTEDNYVLQNWIDLPASVTSDCTVSGNWVYTPPTPPTDIYVNVNVTSAIDDRIYIQNVYISTDDGSEKQVSFNGAAIDKNETTSRTNVEYPEAGTTITKVEVQYTAPGFNGRKEIPYRDWHCTNGRLLNEGDTLYITVNI